MAVATENVGEWQKIIPKVNSEAEFIEIVHDFGNPLELVREAVSNAIDAEATWMRIHFKVEDIDGNQRTVITLEDNGHGMGLDVISTDFWGLGYSRFREKQEHIGEKGHGTKIYLRSESVSVKTQSEEGAYESECIRPLSDLRAKKLHQPRVKAINKFQEHSGTIIKIIGYNDNERSKFVQDIVKDYLLWFTKVGSIEKIFGKNKYDNFKVYLQAIDAPKEEIISFGHTFPDENADIGELFKKCGIVAADQYVKRYVWPELRLANHPEVTFDVVISVEGDEVKRKYNPLLGERRRSETGRYRVADRYGIWLCKDYIPVTRVNEWISNFGSGSNAFVLLHGFINCQSLKLTANRGDIANTDPHVLEELKGSVKQLLEKINNELDEKGIYTLRQWQDEDRTIQQEKSEYTRRVRSLKGRRMAKLDNRILLEPRNEAELFGLFMIVYAMRPQMFDFEPYDYNSNRGIDIIAQNKNDELVAEGQYWYVELKYALQAKRFNHAFKYLRWIVCWDFDANIVPGKKLHGVEGEVDQRELKVIEEDGKHTYFLDSSHKATKVEIIRLKEWLCERLGIVFK